MKNLPINIFGATMGLSGLSLAWFKAFNLNLAPKFIFELFRFFTSLLWIFLVIAYILKILADFNKIKEEFKNPVKINFFAAISFSLLLLSAAWHSKFLWIIGSVLHFSITLLILDFWFFKAKFTITDINPAWFIPPVANLLIPITGANYGYTELNWFFYGFGIMFWVVILNFLLYRLIFAEPLANFLTPTLFIFIAPPVLSFLAYVNLTQELNIFAKNLYFIAVFFALFLVLHLKLFIYTPFSLASWAYSFPLAAFTLATFTMAELNLNYRVFYSTFGLILLLMVSIIIAVLLFKTFIAFKNNKL